MDYFKLIVILFSATGFWKLLEIVVMLRAGRKMQSAEIRNLHAQAESNIVGNWIQWSQILEKRVKELEVVAEENKELRKQIESQRKRICELEKKVAHVEKENEQLRNQLKDISKT